MELLAGRRPVKGTSSPPSGPNPVLDLIWLLMARSRLAVQVADVAFNGMMCSHEKPSTICHVGIHSGHRGEFWAFD